MATRPKILGQLLTDAGEITTEQLDAALGSQREAGLRIGEHLVRLGCTGPEVVCRALATQLGLTYAAPPLVTSPEAGRLVHAATARSRRALPLRCTARSLVVAMVDPLDLSAVDDLQFQTGRRVEVAVATEDAVEDGLALAYGGDLERLVEALPTELRETGRGTDALRDATRAAPVVRLVDRVLHGAVDEGASDIHVEETGADVRVRFRVDGILHQALELPAAARRAVLSRIKVMAGMDISVRRRAQDGRIAFEHGEKRLTLRVSTLPVNGGEKAVDERRRRPVRSESVHRVTALTKCRRTSDVEPR